VFEKSFRDLIGDNLVWFHTTGMSHAYRPDASGVLISLEFTPLTRSS
jgi:hypothetical protein